MASDLGVGDAELATLNVAPADGTTDAVCTVTGPNGTTIYPATGGDLLPIDGSDDMQQLWTTTAPVVYTAPGLWVQHWDVTGTGESAEDFEAYVVKSPTAGGPTWLPGRSRVANYLPHRTLERSIVSTRASEDVYDLSFTSNTIPSGVMVDRLIADGAAWVSARLVNLNQTLFDAAGVIVALYAAAAVERGSPVDDVSLQRANDLEKRMDALVKDLIEANSSANGTDDFGIAIAPMWSFPAADCRWDSPNYW